MLLTVFAPIAGAFLLPMLGSISPRLRNGAALALVLTSLISSLMILPGALTGAVATVNVPLPLGLNFILSADTLAVFMACCASFIGAVIVYYSWGYISHYGNQNEYYFLVTLFLGSMMGIVYAANLVFLYMFWEMTAIASWRLIGFFREKPYVLRADKAFMITVFGALMMLLGFVMVYGQTGSFDYAVIRNSSKAIPIANIAVFFVLFGILSKSATLPLHTWLPDAGVAPSPVTALLHAAVLVKIGVYVFARLFIVTFGVEQVWHTVIPVIAAVSALVSAGAALVDTDLKRIIAYSTVSQIAFIFLGLSTGNEMGVAGGMLYILMHGISKGGLFLCAGIVEQKTHCKDITKLGGLIQVMPITAVSFLLCAFSVMGVPPFGGFFSKYMVISGAVAGGQLWISFTFIIGAFLTVIYLMRAFVMVFMGEMKMEAPREGSFTMVSSVGFLAVVSLISGLAIHSIAGPVQVMVGQMLGTVK